MSDFVSTWETLFGTYTPVEIVDQVTGEVSVMTDWGYVVRCVFFIVVVFCILKIVGGMLKNDRR